MYPHYSNKGGGWIYLTNPHAKYKLVDTKKARYLQHIVALCKAKITLQKIMLDITNVCNNRLF